MLHDYLNEERGEFDELDKKKYLFTQIPAGGS